MCVGSHFAIIWPKENGQRKANVSVDEWLEGGGSRLETTPVATAAAEERPVLVGGPIAEVAVAPVPAEPVVTAMTDVAAQGEEEDSWFWDLLELSGYERW